MISKQTLEMVAEQIFRAVPREGGGMFWDHIPDDIRETYRGFATKVIDLARLPVEIELRQRLLSQRGRTAAAAVVDSYLPEGFQWPSAPGFEVEDSGEVFILALVAALSETPSGGA